MCRELMQGHETKLYSRETFGGSLSCSWHFAVHSGQESECEQVQLTESILYILMQMHCEARKLLVIRMHDCLKDCKARMHKDVTSYRLPSMLIPFLIACSRSSKSLVRG